MDDVVKTLPLRLNSGAVSKSLNEEMVRPSREEAEAAVRTLIRWAGDDPEREGLLDTPKRVAKAYEELYGGYRQDAREELSRVFEEVDRGDRRLE